MNTIPPIVRRRGRDTIVEKASAEIKFTNNVWCCSEMFHV